MTKKPQSIPSLILPLRSGEISWSSQVISKFGLALHPAQKSSDSTSLNPPICKQKQAELIMSPNRPNSSQEHTSLLYLGKFGFAKKSSQAWRSYPRQCCDLLWKPAREAGQATELFSLCELKYKQPPKKHSLFWVQGLAFSISQSVTSAFQQMPPVLCCLLPLPKTNYLFNCRWLTNCLPTQLSKPCLLSYWWHDTDIVKKK